MFSFLDILREFRFSSVLLRLALAMAAGGAVGYGRARKRRSAGMRTYMLTSLGAALTILLAMYEHQMLYGQWLWAKEFADLKFDASRFSSQVINGVGFLAAGTILGVDHQQVSGLTTAIGLFASACLGIAAGAGFYECVVIAVPLLVVSMELMRPLETLYKRRLRNITVCVELDDMDSMGAVTAMVAEHGARVFDIDVERAKREGDSGPSAILSLKLAKGDSSHSAMISSLAELPCVYAVRELVS